MDDKKQDFDKTLDAVWCSNSEDGYDYLMDRQTNAVISKRRNRKRYSKIWRDKNPQKIHQYWLVKSYGISVKDYNTLLEKQAGVCAICFDIDRHRKRLSVDHDHKTDKIRGLLCHKCNVLLGNANDSPSVLRSAATYLENA